MRYWEIINETQSPAAAAVAKRERLSRAQLRRSEARQMEDIRDVPRAAYVDSLRKAAEAGDRREFDHLVDEECRQVLAEMRQKP